jgi:hypothetical protein
MVLYRAAAPATAEGEQASTQSGDGTSQAWVEFSNDIDSQCTVITICGRNDTALLMQVTAVLTRTELAVGSANINSDTDGQVCDIFRVTDAAGKKLPEEDWPAIRQQLMAVLAGSSRSSKPTIFGRAAVADSGEIKTIASEASRAAGGRAARAASVRSSSLRGPACVLASPLAKPLAGAPLTRPALPGATACPQSDTAALEQAATEMAQAANSLVSLERDLFAMAANKADNTALLNKQASAAAACTVRGRGGRGRPARFDCRRGRRSCCSGWRAGWRTPRPDQAAALCPAGRLDLPAGACPAPHGHLTCPPGHAPTPAARAPGGVFAAGAQDGGNGSHSDQPAPSGRGHGA